MEKQEYILSVLHSTAALPPAPPPHPPPRPQVTRDRGDVAVPSSWLILLHPSFLQPRSLPLTSGGGGGLKPALKGWAGGRSCREVSLAVGWPPI